jgi:hypothetical protein
MPSVDDRIRQSSDRQTDERFGDGRTRRLLLLDRRDVEKQPVPVLYGGLKLDGAQADPATMAPITRDVQMEMAREGF